MSISIAIIILGSIIAMSVLTIGAGMTAHD